MRIKEAKVKIRRILQFFLAFVLFRDLRILLVMFRIKSTTSPIEGEFLYRCARDGYHHGKIVEIGSFHGMSTIVMAMGSKQRQREKVYAVDPLLDANIRNRFLENIKREKVEDYIIPKFMKSEQAAKDFEEPIRLLFIDGCHEYRKVREDILLWKDHLIEGAVIALHDINLESIRRAVEGYIINSNEFIVEGQIGYIFFASKKVSKNKSLLDSFARIDKIRSRLKRILDKSLLKV